MARSLQDRKIDASAKKVMPVLIHGDASFSGQGIVTETLNMSQTRGYGVGGTVHLILNNQIGSASSHPRDARSTLYSADIARGVDAPVVHVNADDPDAVAFAARLATDYRMRFGADIVVDQVGYRRYGHFVGDDPKFTQPATQRRIDRHRTVTELYAEQLIQRGLIVKDTVERMKSDALAAMTEALANKNDSIAVGMSPTEQSNTGGTGGKARPHRGSASAVASDRRTACRGSRGIRAACPRR
jgi:2-oxoglutarate dehydrogenase E1 component